MEVRISLTLLLLIFITLKLCNVILWSWWWVLSPVLLPIGFVTLGLTILGVAYGFKSFKRKNIKP